MSRAGKYTAGSKGGKPCNRYEEQKEIQPVSEARKQVTFARVKKHATNAQHRELQPTLKKTSNGHQTVITWTALAGFSSHTDLNLSTLEASEYTCLARSCNLKLVTPAVEGLMHWLTNSLSCEHTNKQTDRNLQHDFSMTPFFNMHTVVG